MKKCCNEHPNHSKQNIRLNRLSGQIEGIKNMISDRRYCIDILTQLKAIEGAVKSLQVSILEDHLYSCLKDAMSSSTRNIDEKIEELLTLFKK